MDEGINAVLHTVPNSLFSVQIEGLSPQSQTMFTDAESARVFLGSAASKILRNSPVPVLRFLDRHQVPASGLVTPYVASERRSSIASANSATAAASQLTTATDPAGMMASDAFRC